MEKLFIIKKGAIKYYCKFDAPDGCTDNYVKDLIRELEECNYRDFFNMLNYMNIRYEAYIKEGTKYTLCKII